MTLNSVSSSQAAQSQSTQTAQVNKKPEVDAARKQSDVELAAKVREQKDNEQRNVHELQVQNSVKPSVNTNGQKTGSLINIAA
jgi:hypothetical protein